MAARDITTLGTRRAARPGPWRTRRAAALDARRAGRSRSRAPSVDGAGPLSALTHACVGAGNTCVYTQILEYTRIYWSGDTGRRAPAPPSEVAERDEHTRGVRTGEHWQPGVGRPQRPSHSQGSLCCASQSWSPAPGTRERSAGWWRAWAHGSMEGSSDHHGYTVMALTLIPRQGTEPWARSGLKLGLSCG